MKMAKASEADLNMAMDLCNALDALGQRFCPSMPEAIERRDTDDDGERFDRYDDKQCGRALRHLLDLADRASLMRVVFGCVVMLDPRNRLVDPAADTIEHHPDNVAMQAARTARPLAEYNDDHGSVLWWAFPINEPPYCGDPKCEDWPDYHTHWTPLVIPASPNPPTPAT